MKIRAITPVAAELPLDRPLTLSFGTLTSRNVFFVHLETDEGVDGWGEVWTNFPRFNAAAKLRLYEQCFARLVGFTFSRPEDVRAEIDRLVLTTGTGRQWGAYGHLMQAVSGIDIAVWDICAKAEGLPLYRYIRRDAEAGRIPAYASGLADDLAAVTERAAAAGFSAFKLKVGLGRARDTENLRIIREIIGDDTLYLDANQGFADAAAAAEALSAYAAYKFSFIEEPLPALDYRGQAALRASGFTLAGGENAYSLLEFSNLFAFGCVDIVQPDVTKCGGLTQALRVRAMTDAEHFAPHMFSGIIGQTASLHLMTAMGGKTMETDVNPNPALTAGDGPFALTAGAYVLKEARPGLGVALDLPYLEKYAIRSR